MPDFNATYTLGQALNFGVLDVAYTMPVVLGFETNFGNSKDVTAPTITDVTPASGSTLSSRIAPVSFKVIDIYPGLRSVVVWAKYANQADTFLVFDGTRFMDRYDASSVRTTLSNGYQFSIVEDGGWSGAIERLWVAAIDQDGNMEGVLPP